VLCGFAWSLPVLILGRTFEALGGCAGMVLGRAIVRDIYDRERSASALATIMMVMSPGALAGASDRRLSRRVGRVARRFRPARHGRGGGPDDDGGEARRDPYSCTRKLRRHDPVFRAAVAVRRRF